MIKTKGFAAKSSQSPLEPFNFERRDPGDHDVLIEILNCGICHSDIHQVRDEWGGAQFPMVPGHEIVGKVQAVGKAVSKFKPGDLAGVGCFVDSCRVCANCKNGLEQHCHEGPIFTYNALEKNKKTLTYGGYSTQIVVDEKYTLKIPTNLSLPQVAPLLCAGITTYSPLKRFASQGSKVGVVGLGGLGHMAVKLGNAMGAEVTVLSSSPKKEKDAKKLGAHHFAATSDPDTFKKLALYFDLIIDTAAGPHDINQYLELLNTEGTLTLVGVPPQPLSVGAFSLIGQRRNLSGSMIGGIKETQEMLDFCGAKNIGSEVEVIPAQEINQAYERMLKGDVHYRFVIDNKTI